MTAARIAPGPLARRERARQRDLAVYAMARACRDRGDSLATIARKLRDAGYRAPEGGEFKYAKQVERVLRRG